MTTQSNEVSSNDSTLAQALALGAKGYKIVPLPPGEKYPKGLSRWQERATNDEAQITDWWGTGEAGIGWAMGRQPNGMNLAAIDVDVANGKLGKETFDEFVRLHPALAETVATTVVSITGSGGRHVVLRVGDAEITNGILGPGLDLRGEGGFIVIPPSVHPNGERYRWAKGRSPLEIEPAFAPPSVVECMATRAGARLESRAPEHHEQEGEPPALGTDATPADWVRARYSIAEMIQGDGWLYMETKGDDSYWCRPDKNPRDGHSAVLHGEAPLVVWSTSAPAAYWRVGRDNHDGSKSLSPLDVYAATLFDGDLSAASSAIRRQMPRTGEAPEGGPGGSSTGAAIGTAALNLPDEFWTSKDWLTQVRDAAWNRLVSPDATLLGVLARYAALVPPGLQLPGLVGSSATFDFIGCSVASSSGGKSVANQVAKELLPVDRRDILMDLPVGSGEGLIQSYFVDEVDENGKKIGQKVGMTAIHFTVDEGTALMEQQNRQGTTIVQTLCSAWSGATLGQANASKETRRIIEGRRVRLAAVINIQTANGHLLLKDYLTAIGLPQRVVFATAHAPLPPLDELPDWPGALRPYIPPHVPGARYVEVAPEIVQEVRKVRYQVATGATVLGNLDGHLTLSRLKLAGLLALIEGEMEITVEHWALADQIVASSKAVRQHLLGAKAETDLRLTEAKVARTVAEEEIAHRQKVARLTDKIGDKVTADPISVGAFKKAFCSGPQKEYFEEALAMAVARGVVIVEEVSGTAQPGRSLRRPS